MERCCCWQPQQAACQHGLCWTMRFTAAVVLHQEVLLSWQMLAQLRLEARQGMAVI